MSAILVIAIEAVLLGAWLLWRGWRGVRVGDHPTCRRCGFDLVGQPAGSKMCPECGADTSRIGATAVGERVRRPVMIVFGAALLLFGSGTTVLVGKQLGAQIEWQRYKPVAWLVRETSSTSTTLRNDALKELLRRQGASQLSPAQMTTIVDAALKVQANPSVAWANEWGDFVEQARRSNQISDAQWNKYIEQAVTIGWLSLTLHAPRGRDGLLYGRLSANAARVGRLTTYYANLEQTKVEMDGKDLGVLAFMPGSAMSLSARSRPSMSSTNHVVPDALRSLSFGTHRGHFAYEIRISDQPPAVQRAPTASGSGGDVTSRILEARRAQATARIPTRYAAPSTSVTVKLQLPFELELTDGPTPAGEQFEAEMNSDVSRMRERMRMMTMDDGRVVPQSIVIPAPLPPTSRPPTPPPSTKPDWRSAQTAPMLVELRMQQRRVREKVLDVPAEDRAAHAGLLKLPNTGIIRLLPREKYDDGTLGLRGGGACYSFARRSHDASQGSDIELDNGRLAGSFLPLGNTAVEDLVLAAPSAGWINTIPADPVQSYLLRSKRDEDDDMRVAVRVIRKSDDGSVLIAYRVLKPGGQP